MYKITIKRKANRITVKKSKPTIKVYGKAKRGLQGVEGPEGGRLYDVIIPTDFPTLSEALAEVSDNTTIFIKPGEYNEVGGTFSQVGISINGGGKESTKLTLGNDLTLTGDSFSVLNIHFDTNAGKKLALLGTGGTVEYSRISNGTVANFFETGDRAGVMNCAIEASSSNGVVVFNQQNRIIGNNFTVAHKSTGSLHVGFYSSFTGNIVKALVSSPGGGPLLHTFGERYVISSNTFFCQQGRVMTLDFRGTVSGNSIFQAAGRGIITAVDGVTIDGNAIMIMTAVGTGINSAIFVNGYSYSSVITGNNISSDGVHNSNPPVAQANQIGIETGSGAKNTIITGNSIAACGTSIEVGIGSTDTLISDNALTFYNDGIVDNGTRTVIRDNIGVDNDTDVKSVVAGTNITVDNTDPNNPIISASGGSTTSWGEIAGDILDQTDLQASFSGIDDEITALDTVKLENITGLVTAGSNITVSGLGTSASPYNIASTGGGGGGGANWESVYDQTVPSDSNFWDITGLDLDTDGEYYFDFRLVNGANVNGWTVRINALSSTYVGQGYSVSGSTVSGTTSWGNRLVNSSDLNSNGAYPTWGRIIRSPFGGVMITAQGVMQNSSGTSPVNTTYTIIRTETTNMTSLRIMPTNWYVYAGSRFRVWKRVA